MDWIFSIDRRTLETLRTRYTLCFLVFLTFVDGQLHFEVPKEKLDSTVNEYGTILLSPGVVFLVVIIAMLGVVMVYNIFITLRVMLCKPSVAN